MLRKDVRPEDARILRNAWLIPAGPNRAASTEGRHGSSGKSSNTRSGSPSRSRSSSGSPSGAFLHLLGSHLAAGSFRGTPVVPTGCLPLSVSGRIGFLSQIWMPAERMDWFSSSCCCGEGGSDLHVQWPPPRSAMLEAPGKAVQRNFHCHQSKSGSGELRLGWCSTTTIFTSFN